MNYVPLGFVKGAEGVEESKGMDVEMLPPPMSKSDLERDLQGKSLLNPGKTPLLKTGTKLAELMSWTPLSGLVNPGTHLVGYVIYDCMNQSVPSVFLPKEYEEAKVGSKRARK